MAFSSAAKLVFTELCSPRGLEKEVKVTAPRKDGYLPVSLSEGLKCSWDKGFLS